MSQDVRPVEQKSFMGRHAKGRGPECTKLPNLSTKQSNPGKGSWTTTTVGDTGTTMERSKYGFRGRLTRKRRIQFNMGSSRPVNEDATPGTVYG